MEVCSTKTVVATFDHLKGILHVRLQAQVASPDLRKSYVEALDFAKIHKIKLWLLDMRNINDLSEQDQDWIHTAFFPKVMSLLHITNYFGLVVSESCYQQLLKSAGISGLKSYNSFIKIQTFYDSERATHWLTTKSV